MDKGTQSSVTSREGRFSGENRRTQDNVASDVKQKTYAAAVQGTAQQTKHRLRRRGKRGNGPVRKEKRRARYMRASASQHAAEPQRDDDTGAETRHKQEQCLTVLLRQQNRLLKQVAAGMHSIQRAITRLGSERNTEQHRTTQQRAPREGRGHKTGGSNPNPTVDLHRLGREWVPPDPRQDCMMSNAYWTQRYTSQAGIITPDARQLVEKLKWATIYEQRDANRGIIACRQFAAQWWKAQAMVRGMHSMNRALSEWKEKTAIYRKVSLLVRYLQGEKELVDTSRKLDERLPGMWIHHFREHEREEALEKIFKGWDQRKRIYMEVYKELKQSKGKPENG